VNSRSLRAILRTATQLGPSLSDAELLRRFIARRDEAAFAALVHRHGRLVWAMCRHLTHSDADADDAFQATFVVLVRNAAKVREPGKLSAWLHGVAHKVCAKARQSARRRVAHEQASASSNCYGYAVADSVWDRAMAAVHEEVARLPDQLRVPFVLCCLEGKGVTEAAEQLGWKLGTLSGRLTRAKDLLQVRLESRGVTVGVAATGVVLTAGLAGNVPAAVLEKAVQWANAGCQVPDSILQLSQGVLAMSMKKPIALATGLCMALCMGLGGARWVATAGAQDTGRPANSRPGNDPARSQVDPEEIQQDSKGYTLGLLETKRKETVVGRTAKWDYDFVLASDMGTTKFVKFLQERETRGWEFNGEVTLQHEGKAAAHWVFRRPNTEKADQGANVMKRGKLDWNSDRQALEAQIKQLQEQLAKTKEAEKR
jgi:RNA polymerase sigma factor (sigma-70 family)